MRLTLLIVASLAFYAALGTLIAVGVAPVGSYIGELQDWLDGRIGEGPAVIVSAVVGIAAVLTIAVGALYTVVVLPLTLIARHAKGR